MADSIPQKKSKSWLQERFRLVIVAEDTLAEINSYRSSGMGIVLSLLGVFMLLFLALSLTIIFTPLRFLIPGYGDIENNLEYIALRNKVEVIEEQLDEQKIYTEGIKNLLNPTQTKIENIDQNDGFIKENQSNSSITPNNIQNISLKHYYFCNPLDGSISAKFDLENKHFGIDIVAKKDAPIKCVLDGVVVSADWTYKTGNSITVQHGDNLISVYKHNSALLKKVGDRVSTGEAIAIIGNTGVLTTGPHVHFELWNNGIALDPELFLNIGEKPSTVVTDSIE